MDQNARAPEGVVSGTESYDDWMCTVHLFNKFFFLCVPISRSYM